MITNLFNNFLNAYPAVKSELVKKMQSNKEWNAEYRKKYNFGSKDKEYLKNKKSLQISKNDTVALLLDEIPKKLFSEAALLENEYKIEGSVGQGEMSEIPWVCVFDKDITESAEKGFYIVYLFRADLSGFYISLNQGWTQYKKTFKSMSLTQQEIKKAAQKLKKTLKTVAGFSFEEINLKGSSDLAKGYELGNICSKYYAINNLPSSHSLINDLQKLIGTYRELKSIVGKEILEIDLVLDEEEFQERSQSGTLKEPKKGKISKKKKSNGSTSSTWWRDPDMAFTAIFNANYQCENNPSHETFKSAVTSHQFVEAHHLIPMEFQDEHEASIDVPENIISLCPNCHRAFHNSTDEIKMELIKKFYSARKNLLKEREITIDEIKLLEYYKTTPNDV